jgi:hypothetical protein
MSPAYRLLLATRWPAARDDPAALAKQVLTHAGGPLFDSYQAWV